MREENQTTSSLGCIICSNVYWWMFFVKANQAKEFEKNDYGVFLNADAHLWNDLKCMKRL